MSFQLLDKTLQFIYNIYVLFSTHLAMDSKGSPSNANCS